MGTVSFQQLSLKQPHSLPPKECVPFQEAEDKAKVIVVRERTPNYHYLALFVYRLMSSGKGGRLEVLFCVRFLYYVLVPTEMFSSSDVA